MSLLDIVSTKKKAIVDQWYQRILATYPDPAARFLQQVDDAFANPVGHTIYQALDRLVEGFIQGDTSPEAMGAPLDAIIRIRAIQEFPPSEALAFIFQGKRIFKAVLAPEIQAGEADWEPLYAWLDSLALSGFDIYMQCRQQVYDLKVKEVKNRVGRLLERAELARREPVSR